MDRFAGHSFHSAQWDHDYDLRGKRVAVIGTGASAVQFVPEIAEQAQRLVVFQRTGNWFLPRKNRAYPPLAQGDHRARPRRPGVPPPVHVLLLRVADADDPPPAHAGAGSGSCARRLFMRWQLRDPELRRKVWPDYTFGCKRILFSSAFLPALQRPNVEVVTERDHVAVRARRRDRRRRRARGRLHHLRHRLQDERLHVPDGDHRQRRALAAPRPGPTARTRTSG